MTVAKFCIAVLFLCLPTPKIHAQTNLGSIISVTSLRVPKAAWEHFDKAREAITANDEPAFQRETAAALKIAPNFASMFVLRATHEIRLGNIQAGLDDALTAHRLEPNVPWSGVTLAGAYNSLHRYADADATLDTLRAPESTTWQFAYEETRATTGLGDTGRALHWSAIALQLAPPTCPEAHLLRANALRLSHRYADAAHELRAFLAADPTQSHPEAQAILLTLEHASTEVASN